VKIRKKHELKKMIESIKKKSLGYNEKMKKSEDIINNYENSGKPIAYCLKKKFITF